MKNICLKLLEIVYVFMAISPILIIFLLKSGYYVLPFFIFIVAYICSNLYIYLKIKTEKNFEESGNCNLIEIAEPKFVPIYIAYFVVSLSIEANNWIIFWSIYCIIFLLIFRCKFTYFNLFISQKWSFYEVEVKNVNKANYKIFIISKENIKNIDKISNLIRLNNFTFLQKDINE
ncbi:MULTISPECIES: hypothetical protein [Campylobacter]|uniref:hypothetical protein n=1 Tax=Campylobacter TaxID=194 RepID=UPI0023F3BBBE|nr:MULTISPECIES: hypothetical protein [Campylobacter]MCI6641019.1 hypothetical protein [Campylobacter sp.]MDD7422473.1 hypothetical protein [Campylobacter hominis]MDY3117403.1 hypothetical protein [Campylobacter hominis]